jgi:hypothetical protein
MLSWLENEQPADEHIQAADQTKCGWFAFQWAKSPRNVGKPLTDARTGILRESGRKKKIEGVRVKFIESDGPSNCNEVNAKAN